MKRVQKNKSVAKVACRGLGCGVKAFAGHTAVSLGRGVAGPQAQRWVRVRVTESFFWIIAVSASATTQNEARALSERP